MTGKRSAAQRQQDRAELEDRFVTWLHLQGGSASISMPDLAAILSPARKCDMGAVIERVCDWDQYPDHYGTRDLPILKSTGELPCDPYTYTIKALAA